MKLSVFDVRVAGIAVALWTVAIIILVSSFGLGNSEFFHFGPSENAHFFGSPVNTYYKYFGIMFYVAVQQLVQTYGLNTITPWLLTAVQNIRVETLEESNGVVLSLTSVWYLYLWMSRIISIQILLLQIDFLLVILLVELVTTVGSVKFFYLAKKRPKGCLLENVQKNIANQFASGDLEQGLEQNGQLQNSSPWIGMGNNSNREVSSFETY